MPLTLTIRDETATGQPLYEFDLEFLTERITVRELIRSRVYQEVKDRNVQAVQMASNPDAQARAFRGLVQPTMTERDLNAKSHRTPRQIDWKEQFAIASEAFERNGFLILVDDRQVDSLEQEIELRAGTTVSFVKLVPLVGG